MSMSGRPHDSLSGAGRAAWRHELESIERRRLLLRSVARIVATTTALFVLHAVLPIPGEPGPGAFVGPIVGRRQQRGAPGNVEAGT